MWAFAKALLLIARYFRRIAIALERHNDLYRLDLADRGIIELKPGVEDHVEVAYGPQKPTQDEEDERNGW